MMGRVIGGGVLLALAVALSLFVTVGSAHARVYGVCADCHAMHASQDGASLAGPMEVAGGPRVALTSLSCAGCHTGDNVVGDPTPYVYSPTAVYGTDTLAGGNFRWVVEGDGSANGHNCLEVPGMMEDAVLTDAPGRGDHPPGTDFSYCQVCHSMAMPTEGYPLTCQTCHQRITNCSSCHLPKHHADDTADGPVGESGGWYRFLNSSNHPNSLTGVIGIEDDDWELTVSATDHNEYNGCSLATGLPDNSLSHYCGGCHGQFHGTHNSSVGADASPWLRHPTSVALRASGETSLYNTSDGISVGPYNPLAPVARDPAALTAGTGLGITVTPGADQVMCLSCHAAHGTPYADMLRWDYDTCNASTTNADCGCFVCHTAKD